MKKGLVVTLTGGSASGKVTGTRLVTHLLGVFKGDKGEPGDRIPITRTLQTTSTLVPDPVSEDVIVVLGLDGPMAIANPGPVASPQRLLLRIKDNGTAQPLFFGDQYRSIVTPLPSQTLPGQTLYLGFMYNADDDTWDLLAAAPPY